MAFLPDTPRDSSGSGQALHNKTIVDASDSDIGDLSTMPGEPDPSTSVAPVPLLPLFQPVSPPTMSHPVASPPAVSSTVHQNPNWLSQLKKSFNTEIIEPCSARARHAVTNDEYIEV